MRKCPWCLWLGNTRVFSIRQLRENFDTPIVKGYLIGGGLERWLNDAGEKEILERVKNIDYSQDLEVQLEFIFGVKPDRRSENIPDYLAVYNAKNSAVLTENAGTPHTASSGGSFKNSSFYRSSFRYGKSSFNRGSFRNNNNNNNNGGSYSKGSFYKGSFLKGSYRGGFFIKGSGSFRLIRFGKSGSFSFTSGSFGSFSRLAFMNNGGSFRYYAGNAEITEEEYHRTLINLTSCPLNEYGYGIHLI